jgi:uncharacterized protein YacL
MGADRPEVRRDALGDGLSPRAPRPRTSPVVGVILRAPIAALGAVLGLYWGRWWLDTGWLTGPNTLLYMSVLGLLVAYLVSGWLADRWGPTLERGLRRVADVPPDVVLAGGTGATVALLITVLLNNLLAEVPGFTWYWSLLIAVLLVIASGWFFVVNRRLFSLGKVLRASAPAETSGARDKLVDTSAIIDGRLADVVEARFLDGRLLVPQFVLAELQRIADSDDPLRRKRGRRGLEVLDRLVHQSHLQTEVVRDDPGGGPVDERLVKLCLSRPADLVTTDFNLDRVASLQGVRVLNLHQLANAVKASFLPGERLALTVVKPGREAGQGLAYLEDGTMVVIEDAEALVGRTVSATVTSSLQTNMGRMIFARLDDARPDDGATA